MHFLHLPLYQVDHLVYSDIGESEFPLLIAAAAVHCAPGAICLSAAPLFILCKRHAATLTILVRH